LKDSTVFSKLV